MPLHRSAQPSLTPFELNHGETLVYTKADGGAWTFTLEETSAEIVKRGYTAMGDQAKGDISVYAFTAEVTINGARHTLRREVGSQASFYEPWAVDGVHLWFDAAACAFREAGGFMGEKDWLHKLVCQPGKHGRFAVQDAGRSICPEPMALWYDNPEGRIAIEDCYNGEDCWMGPYAGADAHCGLDINMPAGTVLYAPIDFDDQFYFNSVAAGFNNNRWRGVRRWDDGARWILQSHHLIELTVPQNCPLARGTAYATTAGVWVGSHEHTHFVFRVIDREGEYFLDPWMLFWQMFRDRTA